MKEEYSSPLAESTLKDLSERFTAIHDQLDAAKDQVEGLNDPKATNLYERREVLSLARMRHLLEYLGVPFGWPPGETDRRFVMRHTA